MGLPVHSEPSCGQVKLPRGPFRSYCVSKACAGGSSLCPTSPSHWSTQHPSRAQLFRRGGSHPPRTFAGGASNANFNHHLGASNLTLLLGGVSPTPASKTPHTPSQYYTVSLPPPLPVSVNYRHWPVGTSVYHFGITVHVFFCLSYGFH